MTTSPSDGGSILRTDNVRGFVLMALAFLSLSMCDTLAKLSTSELHPLQVAWTRQLALVAGVLIALPIRGGGLLRTNRPGLQVVRGVLALLSATCFISGVKYVPLVVAVAITFLAPFVVTAFSGLFLGEKVGPRRWTAVIIGFLAVMIILRPGLGAFHPAGFLIVGAATFFALRQLLSRKLASYDGTGTTIAYTALISSGALSVSLPFVWQTPHSATQIAGLAGMAILAATGETLLVTALKVGEAAVLAPVQYTLIIWSTLWGWLVFNELPDIWTGVGATIIILTGLYVFHRERTLAKRTRLSLRQEGG